MPITIQNSKADLGYAWKESFPLLTFFMNSFAPLAWLLIRNHLTITSQCHFPQKHGKANTKMYHSGANSAHLQHFNFWSLTKISFLFWPPADTRALPKHATRMARQKLNPVSCSVPFHRMGCQQGAAPQTALPMPRLHQQVLFNHCYFQLL